MSTSRRGWIQGVVGFFAGSVTWRSTTTASPVNQPPLSESAGVNRPSPTVAEAELRITTFTYDSAPRLTRVVSPPGMVTTFVYDSVPRLAPLNTETNESIRYVYRYDSGGGMGKRTIAEK